MCQPPCGQVGKSLDVRIPHTHVQIPLTLIGVQIPICSLWPKGSKRFDMISPCGIPSLIYFSKKKKVSKRVLWN